MKHFKNDFKSPDNPIDVTNQTAGNWLLRINYQPWISIKCERLNKYTMHFANKICKHQQNETYTKHNIWFTRSFKVSVHLSLREQSFLYPKPKSGSLG